MRHIIISIFCYFIIVFPVETFSANNQDLVHLSTLWNVTGFVEGISPSSEYIIVADGQTRYLVHILTGEVILEVENGEIFFSENDLYIFYFQRNDIQPSISNYNVLNLNTQIVYSVEGIINTYTSNEQYIVSYERYEDIINQITRIHLIETGEIIAEFSGSVSSFSHDLSHVVVHSIGEISHGARVIHVESGIEVEEYLYPIPDYVYSFNSAFNADGTLLALRFSPDETQIIDTTTWDVLYTLKGSIRFSPDGNYIAHNNDDGYSDVQLVEAHTGRVIDEFLGSVGFSRDGQYWVRAEAVDYDVRDSQIIDIYTDEVIFQRVGYSVPMIDEDGIISVWDFSTQLTYYYDANTGDLIRESAERLLRFDEFVIARDTYSPLTYLSDWETDTIYAIGREIETTPDREFVLVSNGVYIDVYGFADTNTDNMPPPRPAQGIATSNPQEIVLFTEPNAENPQIITEGNMLNETYYDVLGQSYDSEWLFVSFAVSGVNGGSFRGWIRNENLETIVDYSNVPVVNPENPLQDLRDIASSQ